MVRTTPPGGGGGGGESGEPFPDAPDAEPPTLEDADDGERSTTDRSRFDEDTSPSETVRESDVVSPDGDGGASEEPGQPPSQRQQSSGGGTGGSGAGQAADSATGGPGGAGLDVAGGQGQTAVQTAAARRARRQAAAEDPLREPEDFVASAEASTRGETRVSVRRRARPLFEDQREALGGDPPRESAVVRTLQRGSRGYQKLADSVVQQSRGGPAETATVDVGGGRSVNLAQSNRGATLGVAAATNLPGAALDAKRAADQVGNIAAAGVRDRQDALENIQAGEGDVDDVAAVAGLPVEGTEQRAELERTAEAGRQQAGQLRDAYQESPNRTAGALAGAVATGALTAGGTGVGAGRGARRAKDAVRTAGSRRTFDISDAELSQTDVARRYDPDVADEPDAGEFPGAQDAELYRENPDEAIRQQAARFTPEEVDQRFAEAGVDDPDDAATLKKALDVEPEGGGRGAGGLETQEGSFESPGAYVGPELSPYFLRVADDPEFSYRPGLPDTGGSPTGTLVRTRVDEPEARTRAEFAEELEAQEEPTALAPPEPDRNVGEIEAVVGPEQQFADIGGRSRTQEALRSVGIGSDFALEIGNRRVPLRPVADPDLVDSSAARRGFLGDERGQVGGRGQGELRTGSLESFVRRGERPTDRPTPVTGTGANSGGAASPASDRSGTSSRGGASSGRRGSPPDSFFGRGGGSSGGGSGGSGDSGGSGGGSDGGGGSGGDGGGTSGSASSAGGSSTGGSSGGSGASSGGVPALSTPTQPRRRRRTSDREDKDQPLVPLFGGARETDATDFQNPLTGELLKTDVDNPDVRPEEPAFLGFVQGERQ